MYAQTIIQLFNQLQEKGYTATDLDVVAKVHKVAIRLHSGRYEGSGKTFMAHNVGTASILASLSANVAIVAAGLIHNAYEVANSRQGASATAFRDYLKREIPPEVDSFVSRFPELRATKAGFDETLASLDDRDRGTALLQVANIMEHCLDRGPLYRGDRERFQDMLRSAQVPLLAVARGLGYLQLAEEFESLVTDALHGHVPETLRCSLAPKGAFDVPRSFDE
jgi:hypothetical protein